VNVRKADINDLQILIEFISNEAIEAEGTAKAAENLEQGIRKALEDESIAMYWVLVDKSDIPIASISALREWSDWHAGYYWWIQSMYIKPDHRGKGYMPQLIAAVRNEMHSRNGLELRLYVHKDNIKAIRAYEKASFEKSPYEIMVLKN
jgi:RimJ/RimL family protein N-acetyltransferase